MTEKAEKDEKNKTHPKSDANSTEGSLISLGMLELQYQMYKWSLEAFIKYIWEDLGFMTYMIKIKENVTLGGNL